MKVGIVTFHFVHNNGAMLQCWAMQEKLKEMGHNPVVINYRPKYHTRQYSAWRSPKYVKGIKRKIKTILLNYRYFERKKKETKFLQFEKNYQLTQCIRQLSDFTKIGIESFDAIICGSDQVWNEKLTNGKFDSVYFASIPDYHGVKIAYAVSIGETDIYKRKEELKELIEPFDVISTREKQTELILQTCFPDIFVSTVPDPTLLLQKDDYQSLMVKTETPEKYILVYKLENNDILKDICNRLARKIGIPIINISPTKLDVEFEHRWIMDVTPGEFVTYIANAEIVITNSFHGSVFSLIFNKKVLILPHSNRNDRISNLINILEASACMVQGMDDIERALRFDIDYKKVNERIDEYRRIGENFLKEALN